MGGASGRAHLASHIPLYHNYSASGDSGFYSCSPLAPEDERRDGIWNWTGHSIRGGVDVPGPYEYQCIRTSMRFASFQHIGPVIL